MNILPPPWRRHFVKVMMPERETFVCRFQRLENNEASHPLLATCVSEIGELQNWEECLLASQAVSRGR
ncbi:hypothetical protein MWG58_31710 [Streptomyces sp. WAC00276]|uniref:hypothetical protein n=1 Tax=Streptomyces sp. WAC00276 TaxID=2933778 RepID=UPI001FFFF620|nr:hypothetical protein [Streptomyces sp. WAC00276]MCK2145392.1 hypothetical protein [Streptomyces sp. WAC00276]